MKQLRAILSPLAIAAVLVFSQPLTAQNIDDNGPHVVGWRDVHFTDSNYGRGQVDGRIYYPATSAGENTSADASTGPFPLVSFMHGWTQEANEYDDYCTHLASWGFVVMSNNTETGVLFVSMLAEALDTRALMQWVEDESQTSASWLADMVDYGDWGTCGHSMGGGATSYLVKHESRVRAVVMFEPYLGPLLGNTRKGFNSFDEYTGSVMVIGSSLDLTNNWSLIVRPWYEQAVAAQRRSWALVQGGDHFGSTDWAGTNGTLSGSEQHRMHRRFGTGFLRAEMLGEESTYYDLLGAGASNNPIDSEAAGTKPPLWLLNDPHDPAAITFGSSGDANMQLRFAAALAPGTLQTPWGIAGLDAATFQLVHDEWIGSNGVVESSVTPPGSLSGTTLYFQCLLSNGSFGEFSRVAALDY
jgi:hypothetical protein